MNDSEQHTPTHTSLATTMRKWIKMQIELILTAVQAMQGVNEKKEVLGERGSRHVWSTRSHGKQPTKSTKIKMNHSYGEWSQLPNSVEKKLINWPKLKLHSPTVFRSHAKPCFRMCGCLSFLRDHRKPIFHWESLLFLAKVEEEGWDDDDDQKSKNKFNLFKRARKSCLLSLITPRQEKREKASTFVGRRWLGNCVCVTVLIFAVIT